MHDKSSILLRLLTPFEINLSLGLSKTGKSFIIASSNEERRYRIKMSDETEIRKYNLRPNFLFEKDFYFTVSSEGIFKDNFSKRVSDRIKLTYNSQICNPVIFFDSVGRIRFENPRNN